jgi:uncharacterized membrane protein
MTNPAAVMIALIATLHLYFMVLEMFFWDKPLGMRTFGIKPEFAKATRTLAANQGLYNGFIAAGLIWGQNIFSDMRDRSGCIWSTDRKSQDIFYPGTTRDYCAYSDFANRDV